MIDPSEEYTQWRRRIIEADNQCCLVILGFFALTASIGALRLVWWLTSE